MDKGLLEWFLLKEPQLQVYKPNPVGAAAAWSCPAPNPAMRDPSGPFIWDFTWGCSPGLLSYLDTTHPGTTCLDFLLG